jgi:YidC/Oxa1 family membrane protein insertase
MERRALIAAVLMAALLVIYQMYFFPASQEPQPKPSVGTPATAPREEPASAPATVPVPATPPATPRAPLPKTAAQARASETPRPPQRLAAVDTPFYHAVVSSEGGKLQEFVLRYRGEKPLVIVGDLGPAGLLVAPDPKTPGDPVAMSLSAAQISLGPARATEPLVLNGLADGLAVRETLVFEPDGYAIDIQVRVENRGTTPRTIGVALPWLTRQVWHGVTEKFQGQHPSEIVWAAGGQVERIDDLTTVGERVRDGDWIALGSVWYLAALVPRTPGFKLIATSEPRPPDAKNGDKAPAGRSSISVRAVPTIAPGQAWEGRVLLYAGPKEYERLRALGLQDTINFGGFPVPRKWGGLPMAWIGVPILLLMNWVYKYVGNYGVAIILLTVLSKVLFYPLTVKSMRSMKAMQTLQPLVNTLRNKYKSDPQRLQKETMELYRKHGANPLGGCLPMVAQVPVFYALYLALSVSVELQSAPFVCFGQVPAWVPLLGGDHMWICDLAGPDPTKALPILMGISMFVQQKMTPTSGDPRQQKMMLFIMPVFFTWMFLGLASGLNLYWTLSNVLQILQQWYMNRSGRGPSKGEAKDAGRA